MGNAGGDEQEHRGCREIEYLGDASGCQGGNEKQRQPDWNRNGHALQGRASEHAASGGGVVEPEKRGCQKCENSPEHYSDTLVRRFAPLIGAPMRQYD
jgi:hypothetical protein